MTKLTRPAVTSDNATEYEVHRWSTEASDLAISAGRWPAQLSTSLGNKLPFMRRSKKVDADGDIMWVTYEQANGCLVLRVFND